MAARAVVWASRQRRREVSVGGLTGLAIGALNGRRSWHGRDANGYRSLAAFANGGLVGALAASMARVVRGKAKKRQCF